VLLLLLLLLPLDNPHSSLYSHKVVPCKLYIGENRLSKRMFRLWGGWIGCRFIEYPALIMISTPYIDSESLQLNRRRYVQLRD